MEDIKRNEESSLVVVGFLDRHGTWLGHGGHSFRCSAEGLGFEGSQRDCGKGSRGRGFGDGRKRRGIKIQVSWMKDSKFGERTEDGGRKSDRDGGGGAVTDQISR